MSGTVALPWWLAAILLLLAGWAVLDRLLVPGLRWFVRRRINIAIEEINQRLHVEIPRFALTKRRVLIDRLTFDPKVLEAVDAFSREKGIPREVLTARVERYAREIVPSFNAYAYFRIGYWLARRTARLLYRVRVGFADEEGLAAVDPKSSIVFVMNHRSNMDYILVAYLAATRTALSYAVGEWARIWPLQTLIRTLGAYFIRRNSGDPFYRLVLERYVAMATDAGVVQAIFPEGGLTKDGALRPPKLGLLGYVTRAFDPSGERDIVFIPVGINYDRVFEDRSQILALDADAPGRGLLFVLAKTAEFVARNVLLMLRGRWYRFGYACVNFGTPVSLKRYCRDRSANFRGTGKEDRFRCVDALASELMESVGRVIPVLPVPLVAAALLGNGGTPVGLLDLKSEVQRLMGRLEARGAQIYIPRKDRDYAVEVGLRMLTLRRVAIERDGLFFPAPGEEPMLRYYANSIAHLIA